MALGSRLRGCSSGDANRFVMALGSKLRGCASGNCIQRDANRFVKVASRWLWVGGWCAQLVGIALREMQIALVVSRWIWIEISIEKLRESKRFQ